MKKDRKIKKNKRQSGMLVGKVDTLIKGDGFSTAIKWGFIALLAVQIIFLIYVNLFENEKHLGFDASNYYLKAIEMWKQKTLFPQNWVDQTTLHIDSPCLPAAILYGITGKIGISYGIANLGVMAATLLTLYSIMSMLGSNTIGKIFAFNLFLTPYVSMNYNNVNPIDYFPCLLTSASYFSVKLLTMLLTLRLIIRLNSGMKFNLKEYFLAAFLIGLMGLSGLSSGYYMLMVFIIPCYAFLMVQAIIKADLHKLFNASFVWLTAFSIIIAIGKYFTVHQLGFVSRDSQSTLIGLTDFWHNAGSMVMGLVSLLGVTAYRSDTPTLSLLGLTQLICWGLAILLIVLAVYTGKTIGKRKNDASVSLIYLICLTIMSVNIIILLLTNTTYSSEVFECRYLIPFFILGTILLSYGVTTMKKNSYWYKFGGAAMLFILIVANIVSQVSYTKAVIDVDVEKLPSALEKYDAKVVYGYGEKDDLQIDIRNLRVLDTEKCYKTVLESGGIFHWGDYTNYDDNAEYDGQTLIVTTAENYKALPSHYKSKYEYKESVGRFDIYVADENYFDFTMELSDKKMTRDFPYTPGIIRENMNEKNGDFITNGKKGIAMRGNPVRGQNGSFDIKLNYEPISSEKNELGKLLLEINDHKPIESDIRKDANSAIIKNVKISDKDMLKYSVTVNDGAIYKIKSIEFKPNR